LLGHAQGAIANPLRAVERSQWMRGKKWRQRWKYKHHAANTIPIGRDVGEELK
jgi:hypothetical protein